MKRAMAYSLVAHPYEKAMLVECIDADAMWARSAHCARSALVGLCLFAGVRKRGTGIQDLVCTPQQLLLV